MKFRAYEKIMDFEEFWKEHSKEMLRETREYNKRMGIKPNSDYEVFKREMEKQDLIDKINKTKENN